MKKIITLMALSLITNCLIAQSGRIKISFAGFDCYRETWDDILHADGKGDEVFFNFGFTLADKNGNTKLSYEKRTAVYGDNTSPAFSNRINAGSFTDAFGNKRGGIKAGDTYRCNDPVGEFDMANGDIITIIPTGWEHDPIADNSASFFSTIRGFHNSINQKAAPLMIGFNALTGNIVGSIYTTASLGISSIKAGGEQGELGRAGTRPIGMQKYGDFSANLVILNTPNLNTFCNSDMGFGKGVIAVNYDENALGNARDHGNYSILIKIEFIPSYDRPAPPPAPSNNNQSTPPPPPPPSPASNNNNPGGIKKIVGLPKAIVSSAAGVWTGTYGTGENNNPHFYSFKLNADGSMQVVDVNGNAIATGNYKFSNNQLTGTYAYTNNNMTFSFAATLSGSQLNGTWGSGSNTSGGGKWVMNK